MDRVTEPLRDAKVWDAQGAEHALGEAWRERPAVLAFLRHFG